MKKFKKDLNSSTFMYQGRSVNASNRPTDQKKNNVTLKSLNIGNQNAAGVASKGITTVIMIQRLKGCTVVGFRCNKCRLEQYMYKCSSVQFNNIYVRALTTFWNKIALLVFLSKNHLHFEQKPFTFTFTCMYSVGKNHLVITPTIKIKKQTKSK